MQYQHIKDISGNTNLTLIQRTDDNGIVSTIPIGSGNIDAQMYLAWLAAGNTPLPPAS